MHHFASFSLAREIRGKDLCAELQIANDRNERLPEKEKKAQTTAEMRAKEYCQLSRYHRPCEQQQPPLDEKQQPSVSEKQQPPLEEKQQPLVFEKQQPPVSEKQQPCE